MTVAEVSPHSFNKYLAILEETLKRYLDNKAKIRKNVLEDASVFAEIKNEHEIHEYISSCLRNGKVLAPNEFAGSLRAIIRDAAIDGLVKPYEQVYMHGLSGFARSAMMTVGSAVADDLRAVLPVQLKFVLSGAVSGYLNRNPGSKEYVLDRLRELESADCHACFAKAMLGLGVPGDIANLLSKAIWDVASHYSSRDTYLDGYILSLVDAISEVKHSLMRTKIADNK